MRLAVIQERLFQGAKGRLGWCGSASDGGVFPMAKY
jgi:hypothetical protein